MNQVEANQGLALPPRLRRGRSAFEMPGLVIPAVAAVSIAALLLLEGYINFRYLSNDQLQPTEFANQAEARLSYFWSLVFVSITAFMGLWLFARKSAVPRIDDHLLSTAYKQPEISVEDMPQAFAVFSRLDNLLACNQKFRDLYSATGLEIKPGLSFRELMKASVNAGLYAQRRPKMDPFEYLSLLERKFHHFLKVVPEYEDVLSDGRILSVSQHRTVEGNVAMLLSDITALKAAECKLAEERNMALKESAAKSRYFSQFSQEVRRSAEQASSMLNRLQPAVVLPGIEHLMVKVAQQGAAQIELKAKNAADFGLVTLNELTLQHNIFRLEPLLVELIGSLEEKVSGRELSLKCAIDEDVPALCFGDEQRLMQSLYWLVSVAIDYSRLHGASLSVRRKPQAEKLIIEFMVSCGESFHHEKLLSELIESTDIYQDAFTRLGTKGMNIALAKSLASLMNGRISLDTSSGNVTGICLEVELQNAMADEIAAFGNTYEISGEAETKSRMEGHSTHA